MEQSNRPLNLRNWWLKVVLSLLLLGRSAGAQIADTFYNNGYYNSVANINATNVINDYGGTFSVNIPLSPSLSPSWPLSLFAGWHYTQNFVNNGEMDSTFGFWFDTQISGHTEAASFSNAGLINCDTSGTNVINEEYVINDVPFTAPFAGGVYVFATNIVNSGTINVGIDGMAQFIGNNLDFTRGNIGIVDNGNGATINNGCSSMYPHLNALGTTGTNNGWFPAIQLTPTTAQSGFLNILFTNLYGVYPVIDLALTNTTPYFDEAQTGPSNVTVWAVFLENDNTNAVTANVYFGSTSINNSLDGFFECGLPHGHAHVEWIAPYFDPNTGGTSTRYLYLDDDYEQGSSTNILCYASPGVPCNYTFTITNSQVSYGVLPAPSSFPPFFGTSPFPPAVVNTNIYSFVNAQFSPLSYPTNSFLQVTNVPGRIQITASNELNLSLTTISGGNYLLLKSTNQFDYDGQSLISSPLSDIYLGCTNGSFALTNAILPNVPEWQGTVQAWSTRWFYTDTNSGTTYDFRVMLVGSALSPTNGSSQEKDLMLYGTNNIVISDVLNIFGNFSINCTNLLLTTNGPGAASPDGELNLNSPAINWATSVPRLSCLTNNGAIRTSTASVVNFGSLALPYLALVNNGIVSNSSGSTIISADFENSGYFSTGGGSFAAVTLTTTMSNATIVANGTFTNTGASVVIGGSLIQVGKSFTLLATNLLTDDNCTNGNFWSLGGGNGGAGKAVGLVLPIKPAAGDLLDTIISNTATAGTAVTNFWAGLDFGQSNSGYTNNAAIGWLSLDALGQAQKTQFYFSGPGVSNAMYVDCLELRDFATNRDSGGNVTNLLFNTNLVIYYAQALIDGFSVAEKLNHKNGNHLRWVATYAGRFSSTNIVYPNGTTNTVNAALAASPDTDSNGNGTPNGSDPTPFFVSSEVQLSIAVTNVPPRKVKLSWFSIPGATNFVSYRTNLVFPGWQPLTNFVTTGSTSPTNLTLLDTIVNTVVPRFYQVEVVPDNADYFPPGY
jgi:hypothetical protein